MYPRDCSGYHPINSVVATIDLFDFIEITVGSGHEIVVDCHVCPGMNNIAWKAVECFKRFTGIEFFANIKIEKNIPHGAGLGGGSSDAMTIIKGLNNLLNMNFSNQEITKIASEIGSDVPLFFQNGWSQVEGYGEKVTPIQGFHSNIVIAYPNHALSTKDVYETWDKLSTQNRQPPSLDKRLEKPYNSLTKAATTLLPEIEQVIERLNECGCQQVSMTGSGSAVFGTAGTEDDSIRIETKMREFGYFVFSGSVLA